MRACDKWAEALQRETKYFMGKCYDFGKRENRGSQVKQEGKMRQNNAV